jgi:hypothetical protein
MGAVLLVYLLFVLSCRCILLFLNYVSVGEGVIGIIMHVPVTRGSISSDSL